MLIATKHCGIRLDIVEMRHDHGAGNGQCEDGTRTRKVLRYSHLLLNLSVVQLTWWYMAASTRAKLFDPQCERFLYSVASNFLKKIKKFCPS